MYICDKAACGVYGAPGVAGLLLSSRFQVINLFPDRFSDHNIL